MSCYFKDRCQYLLARVKSGLSSMFLKTFICHMSLVFLKTFKDVLWSILIVENVGLWRSRGWYYSIRYVSTWKMLTPQGPSTLQVTKDDVNSPSSLCSLSLEASTKAVSSPSYPKESRITPLFTNKLLEWRWMVLTVQTILSHSRT